MQLLRKKGGELDSLDTRVVCDNKTNDRDLYYLKNVVFCEKK